MVSLLLQAVFAGFLLVLRCQAAITLHQQQTKSDDPREIRRHNTGQNHFRQNTKFKHIETAKLSYRPEITKKSRVQPEVLHRVVIVRKQNNIKKLEDILLDVSNPASVNYGNHLSKERIAALTANPDAVDYIKDFLLANNIHDWNATRYDDYISAVGPVHVWESLFDTQFFEFEHTSLPGKRFIRCMEYSLPEHLTDYVDGVFNTVQFPDHHVGKRLRLKKHTVKDLQAGGTVTPALLNQVYNIANNTGNHLTSQAVYAILDQTFSPSDLTTFQNLFNLPREGIAGNVGGHVANNACASDVDSCMEANLDVQYMMAVAQNVPTTYYYWTGDDVWLDWIESVANLANPPDVFSISYGSYEAAFSSTYLQAFDVEACKLGVAGTTVLAASGDDGVAGFLVKSGSLSCAYYASFPASSLYVTAVGGTMGPESGTAEMACQSSLGSRITTGGGFSHTYALPSWQTTEVNGYFARVAGTSKAPKSGYNPTKRGYPDISALANKYQVVANGMLYTVSGTSASCPVVAGMVSLVNSARRAAGNSTLGWLNPALYALHPAFVNDVTSGDNRCLSTGSCCAQGFYATTGWDPVTGLGSIDFAKFLRTFTTLRTTTEPPAHSPAIVLDEKAWYVFDGYSVAGCPSKKQSKVIAQSGYPVNQCLIQYDNASQPVSSMRYSCDTSLGHVTMWKFSDLECSIGSFVDIEQNRLGCVNLAVGSSIFRSINVRCTTMSGTDLPLPSGKHMVERAFNHPSQCPLNATAYFHSWRTGHCFVSGYATSFLMTEDGQELSFNDTQCSNSRLAQTVTYSTVCATASDVEDSEYDADVRTGLRVTYLVYDVPGDSKNKGLSSAAVGGIVAGVAFALICLCCCCVCFTFCRRRSVPSTHPTTHIGHVPMGAPVMATTAQVALPMYDEHYVQGATVSGSGANKYQPVPV